MKEYHKIETIFKRDMEGTKKLIEGEFRDITVEFLKDCKWIGKEKVDGTNIRVYWDGYKVQIGGRTDRAELHIDLLKHIQSKFCTNEAEQLFEQMFGDKEVYLFGEGFGAGIQKGGGCYSKEKSFILFDVLVGDYYLQMPNVEEIAKAFDVPVVPVMKTGTLQELVDFVKSKPNSQVAIEPYTIEGLVAVPEVEVRSRDGSRVIVKIKVEDFK